MSRWIEADALKYYGNHIGDEYEGEYHDAQWVYRSQIDDAPSIDIVRCNQCKYEPICSHSVQHTTHEPTSVTIGYKSVDFCSYGERKNQ